MTNTRKNAIIELDILSKKVKDSTILPFRKEILDLCEAFGKQGYSGGVATYVANNLSKIIEKLILQEPISDITGDEFEWVEVDENMYQNSRCAALFKSSDNKAYYLDAVVFKDGVSAFTGSAYLDESAEKLIYSRQYVSFPFFPKTFYMDVYTVEITKEEAKTRKINYIEDLDGTCRYYVVKNPSKLKKVFKYYTEYK